MVKSESAPGASPGNADSEQRTVTIHRKDSTLTGRGRHDPCVLPRAVAMVEAMAALVLADHALRHDAIRPK